MRTLIIIISVLFIASLSLIYYLTRLKKEKMYSLFATLSSEHLKLMIIPLVKFISNTSTIYNTIDLNMKKSKTITPTSKFKKY